MRVWPLLALAAVLLVPPVAAEPVAVAVDVHVIGFGNYDVNRGTYTFDLYLHLSYDEATAPADFDVTRFEFMNGRATSKEFLTDETIEGTRHLWWRIQAALYSEPRFDLYPFDRQTLKLQLEDAIHPSSELVYVPALTGNGLDSEVKVAGWKIRSAGAEAQDKVYDFEETYSRFSYEVDLGREALSAALRTFLPPLAFMIVSGLSFALHASKVAQRIAFGTSMLISAVAFHVSQTISLPTLGRLTLFDQVMLSTYAFLAASLVVTALIARNEDYHKQEGRSEHYNRMGLWASLALPVVVFLVLRALG